MGHELGFDRCLTGMVLAGGQAEWDRRSKALNAQEQALKVRPAVGGK